MADAPGPRRQAAAGGTVPEPLPTWEGCTAEELAAGWRAPRVMLYRRVGSTNDVARAAARSGAAEGTLVLAEEQTAGRGRVGRPWSSPPGLGLWVSIVLRPRRETFDRLPITVGIAVAEALDPWTTESPVRVKWPNDLLLGGRKLGGILCEGSWDGGRLEFVVVGIGLNLLQSEADFPEGIRDRAVSLRAVAGAVSRFDVASRIVDAVRSIARESGDPETADEWFRRVNSRDALLGRDVRVVEPESGSAIAAGRAAGIQADGSLRLGTATGTINVRAGTVELVNDGHSERT